MDNRDLLKRARQAKSDRANVEAILEAIAKYVTPFRGEFFNDTMQEGSLDWLKSRNVYDSTAIEAHQNLSASIHGAVSSPSIRWFHMRFRNRKLNKDTKAKVWLQETSEQIFYSLQDSNFDTEINETYQDICGPGTGILTLEDGERGNLLDFTAVPLKEAFFEEDHRGRVRYFFRRLEWDPGQIISKFGEDGVPNTIKKLDAKGDKSKLIVWYVIFPRHGRQAELGQKLSPSKRPWGSRYILDKDASTLGKEGGYYEMPSYAPRWRKTSGSKYGNSPAMVALGDILTLNEARMMQLVASEKLIDPPLFAEERALISDLRLKASSLSVVRRIEGIKAFETKGSIAVSDHMVDQLQNSIRRMFFANQLTFPDPQAQPMTAAEVQVRYELMQRLLGPTLGRIQNDLLNPIVERTYRMLARAGVLSDPPDIVLNENAEFDIEYLGALARSQKVESVAASERWAGMAAGLAEVFPRARHVVDAEELVREAGHALGIPAAAIRDEGAVKKAQEEEEAMQTRMMQAQAREAEGKAAAAEAGAMQAEEGAL